MPRTRWMLPSSVTYSRGMPGIRPQVSFPPCWRQRILSWTLDMALTEDMLPMSIVKRMRERRTTTVNRSAVAKLSWGSSCWVSSSSRSSGGLAKRGWRSSGSIVVSFEADDEGVLIVDDGSMDWAGEWTCIVVCVQGRWTMVLDVAGFALLRFTVWLTPGAVAVNIGQEIRMDHLWLVAW